MTLVVAVGGCSLFADDDKPEDTDSVEAAAPPDVVAGLEAALDDRASAVRHADRKAFLAGLARGDRALRRDQATYLANLQQLPLGSFRYSFDAADLVRDGEDYWVVVDLRMELEGYDDRPVVTRDRYLFTSDRSAGFLLASVTDLQWEAEHQIQQQPWESTAITVRRLPGVLGIFDKRSVPAADALLKSVQQGIVYVAAVVPYEWSRSVVVYALSDTAFLDSIPDLPGSDPETLDGVAFPVPAGPDSHRLAATRFVIHPRMLDRAGPARDRLVRHELTHVAIGEHDDHAPVWLSEGLAEYTSVRPMAPEDRDIPQKAIAAARAGFKDLPPDEAFNDEAAAVHYAQSWWACEYIASGFDQLTLWSLLDQLGEPDADQAEVLATYTGLNSRQLARKAGKLLLATYDPSALDHPPAGPEPNASPGPTESPTESPSESPSSTENSSADPADDPTEDQADDQTGSRGGA